MRPITKNIRLPLAVCLSMVMSCKVGDKPGNPEHKIIIEANVSPDYVFDLTKEVEPLKKLRIQYIPLHDVKGLEKVQVAEKNIKNGKARWVIYSSEDLLLSVPFSKAIIIRPKDSICINYTPGKVFYNGKDIDTARLSFINEIMDIETQLKKPTKYSVIINSLEEYLEWNRYIDAKLSMLISIIDKYKDKLPSQDYNYYKTRMIAKEESDRAESFGTLVDISQKTPSSRLSTSDLIQIWDSTQNKPWANWVRSLENYQGSMEYFYVFNRIAVQRKFNFDYTNDSLQNKEKRTYLYYTNARDNYKGLTRERLMAFLLDEQTITEMGLKNPMTQTLLKDYFGQPGYPEYKQLVKELEEKRKIREAEKEKQKT